MKTVIHLSDLHFGKVDTKRINPLIDQISKIKPDLIVVSGDFTQRATEKEYKAAKKFLGKLKYPVFVVPGNHDIPLFNIYQRFVSPFKKYTKFISSDLAPFYCDENIAVVGINSVRRYTITSGRISKKQIRTTANILDSLDPKLIKIVVCHHPFDLPHSAKTIKKHTHKVVAHSKSAMKHFSDKKVDVFLSGHLHLTHIGDTKKRYKIKNYGGLIIQAGTATSSRTRSEPVSFNVLKIKRPFIRVENYVGEELSPEFVLRSTQNFKNSEEGWKTV
ncbi:MAG: metallophosphoesterase [bacterium]